MVSQTLKTLKRSLRGRYRRCYLSRVFTQMYGFTNPQNPQNPISPLLLRGVSNSEALGVRFRRRRAEGESNRDLRAAPMRFPRRHGQQGPSIFFDALRAWNLGLKSVWPDEAITYWISQGTVSHILSQNAFYNSAPPTFVFAVSLLSHLSDSEVVLRSLPLVGGILSIPAMFLLARTLLPARAALFATLLVATTAQQVHYSQELREYSWTFVLSCLMLTAYIHADRAPSSRNAALLALVCIGGIALQYGLLVLLASLNVVYGVRWLKRQTRLLPGMWAGVQTACLVMALLVYKVSAKAQMQPTSYGSSWSRVYLQNGYWNGHLASLPVFIISRTVGVWKFACSTPGLVFPVLGLLALVLLLRRSQRDKPAAPESEERANANLSLLLWGAVSGLTVSLAMLHKYPYLNGRQMMFLTPTIFLLCGWGFVWLENSRVRRLGVPALLLWTLVCVVPSVAGVRDAGDDPTRDFVVFLRSNRKPGDRLWMLPSIRPSYTFYERRFDPLVHVSPDSECPGGPVPSFAENAAQVRAGAVTGFGRVLPMQSLENELRRPGRVWLWAPQVLQPDIQPWLAQVRALRPNVRLARQHGEVGFLFKAD